jgi:hypothetical protein
MKVMNPWLYPHTVMHDKSNSIMMKFVELRNFFLKKKPQVSRDQILPLELQISAWRKATRKMNWEITKDEFDGIETPPPLTEDDRRQGFKGVVLFYGFGDDGCGNSDAVFSGKVAWEYAVKSRKGKTWQCEYVDFHKPEDIRIRPKAPVRPKDFYYGKILFGKRFVNMTVSQLRKKLGTDTGCGPEGFQFLAITHPHFADLMTERKMPFMALADYDVAPYGFNDLIDAPQMFCSNNILGLGIGNVERNYPLFGIPTLRFCS